jgi:hypothetical protein
MAAMARTPVFQGRPFWARCPPSLRPPDWRLAKSRPRRRLYTSTTLRIDRRTSLALPARAWKNRGIVEVAGEGCVRPVFGLRRLFAVAALRDAGHQHVVTLASGSNLTLGARA